MATTRNLYDFIQSYPIANDSDIAKFSNSIQQLSQLIQSNHIIKINDEIIRDNQPLPTAGSIGISMFDSEANLTNLLIIKPDYGIITLNNNAGGINIGDGDDLFIIDDIEQSIDLHTNLNAINHNHRIIISPSRLFSDTVAQFSTKSQVTIFCSITEENTLIRQFSGQNVRLISLIDPFYNDNIGKYPSFEAFLADKEVKNINCLIGEWGNLGEIKSNAKYIETPYPIHAFNRCKTAEYAIRALSDHLKIPLPMAGQAVLGVLSHIAQRRVNAPMKDGSVPCSLWLLTQGESGDGKSKTTKWASKALTDFENANEIKYKQALKDWNKLDFEQKKDKEPPIKPKREIVKRATTEGLLDKMLLEKVTDILFTTTEAGGFFNSYSFKSETKSATLGIYTDIHGGYGFDRILSKGASKANLTGENEHIENARITFDLQGQPPVLHPILTDDEMNEQGFLVRFLYSFPEIDPDSQKLDENEQRNQIIHDMHLQDFWHTCTELLKKYPHNAIFNEIGEFVRTELKLDDNAQRRYNQYWNECIDRRKEGTALYPYRFMVRRLVENASRIATCLVYFDGRDTITLDDFNNGILIAEYSLSERVRYGKDPENHVTTPTEKVWLSLFNYCQKNKTDWIYKSQFKSSIVSSTFKSNQIFDPIMQALEDFNYIKIHYENDGSTNKKGKQIIKINPKLLK